jgi:hypothetical protein
MFQIGTRVLTRWHLLHGDMEYGLWIKSYRDLTSGDVEMLEIYSRVQSAIVRRLEDINSRPVVGVCDRHPASSPPLLYFLPSARSVQL